MSSVVDVVDLSSDVWIANSDVGLLIDLWVKRVESLRDVVIEGAWLSVVLQGDRDDGSHILRLNSALLLVKGRVNVVETRSVLEVLFSGLAVVLDLLKREVVDGLVSGAVTPVGSEALGLLALLILSLASEPLLPGHSSAVVVPVHVSIDGDEGNSAPEDPTHLPDHPHVGLTHVVSHVEHHYIKYS